MAFKPQLSSKHEIVVASKFDQLVTYIVKKQHKKALRCVDINPTQINYPNKYSWTAFMILLALSDCPEDYQLICDVIDRVQINLINHNKSNCLMIAIYYSNPQYVYQLTELLISKGVDMNHRKTENFSALDVAIYMYRFSSGHDAQIEYYHVVQCLYQKKVPSVFLEKLNVSYDMPILDKWTIMTMDKGTDDFILIYNDTIKIMDDFHLDISIEPVDRKEKTKEEMDEYKKLVEMDSDKLYQTLIDIITKKNESIDISGTTVVGGEITIAKQKEPVIKTIRDKELVLDKYVGNTVDITTIIMSQNSQPTHHQFQCINRKCENDIRHTTSALLKPCSHGGVCLECVYLMRHSKYTPQCPICYRSVDYAIIKS